MTEYGLRFVALAGSVTATKDSPEPGSWLEEYEPDAYDGRGYATFTEDPAKALRFPDVTAALRCWKQVSKIRPVRWDGKPNRPLTAFTVTAEPVA